MCPLQSAPTALCSQMVSEKVGGAEGTKLEDDFKDLERVTCIHFRKISALDMQIVFWFCF